MKQMRIRLTLLGENEIFLLKSFLDQLQLFKINSNNIGDLSGGHLVDLGTQVREKRFIYTLLYL